MHPASRRLFLGRSRFFSGVLLFAGCSAPHVSRRRVLGANERLWIASEGVGGKGWTDLTMVGNQDIVEICDIDAGRLAQADGKFGSARRFADWRRMFEDLGNSIDAVTVSTPDHTHFPPAIRAVHQGWHVFCQKPLTHTIWEARELTRAAKEAGVATQMSNQGVSHPKLRREPNW